MKANWQPSLAFVYRPENDGQSYHISPNDPGGATSWGVIESNWALGVHKGIVTGLLSKATQAQCGLILHAFFWEGIQGDVLPTGVDLVFFNMAMLSGQGTATRIIQRAVSVDEDGVLGPVTMAAIQKMDPLELVLTLTARDKDFFAGLTDAKWFLAGWDRRANDCQTAAMALLNETLPIPPVAPVTPVPAPPIVARAITSVVTITSYSDGSSNLTTQTPTGAPTQGIAESFDTAVVAAKMAIGIS